MSKVISSAVRNAVRAALICALAQSGVAYSQQAAPAADSAQDANRLQEVVVTANYRHEDLQSVGTSIGVLSADELTRRDVTEFIDISRNVPGLNVIDNGPGQKTIFIRGLVGAGESTVGLYYDGMPTVGSADSAAGAGGRQADLYVYDAQQVEVLRGPQSTLYGSSALAGVVRVITNQADPSHSAQELVMGGAATDHGGGSYDVKGMINMPLIDNELAVRLVGYKVHDGGYIDNPRLGTVHINGVDQLGMRANVKWLLGERDTLTAQFFSQNMNTGDQGIGRPYDAVIAGNIVPAVGPLDNDPASRQPRSDATRMAGLTYGHNFDSSALTLEQSYFHRDNTDDQDLAGLPQALSAYFDPVIPQGVFASRQRTKMYTTEARWVTNYSGPLNGIVGLLYQDRVIDIDNQFLQTDVATGLVDIGIPSWYHRAAEFILKQKAAYGELTWKITNALSLTGGLRVFEDDRHDYGVSIVGFMRTPISPPSDLHATEGKAIWKGALNYQFNDNTMGYLSATEGYRAGGTVNQIVPELPSHYGPDYTKNYELGLKNEWFGHRLQVNGALYRINWYDMQYSGDFYNGAFSGVLNCQGLCAHSQGVELEINARPVRGLDLNLATSVLKAQLNQTLEAANGSPTSGTQLAHTPKFTLAAGATYSWDLAGNLGASVHADLQHVGEVALSNYVPSENIPAKAYTLLNASATLTINDRFDVRLYGRNLGNTAAQTTIQEDSVTPAWVYTSRPRTVGFDVTLRSK